MTKKEKVYVLIQTGCCAYDQIEAQIFAVCKSKESAIKRLKEEISNFKERVRNTEIDLCDGDEEEANENVNKLFDNYIQNDEETYFDFCNEDGAEFHLLITEEEII